LLEEAAASGHDLLHQINFQSWTLTADQARTARHNFVAMEKLRGRGASDALLDLQRRLLFLPEGEVVLASEEVGVASLHDAVWAAQVLERHFKNRRGAMRFDPPAFTFSGGHGSYSQSLHNGSPEAEEMACGIHPALMKPPRIGALFASAVDRDSVGRAFDWSGRMRRWFEPALISEKAILRTNYEKAEEAEKQEDADLSLALAVRPKPLEICTGVSDYAFISYRRSDFSRIEPILDSLNTARIPFWFDRGLIGGEQWMSRLQERISSARNFLLFLSPRAVESRYVQMEVHFAYYLERPLILPVELETTPIHEMPGGLGMILGMHNILPVDTLRIIEDLRKNDLKSGSSRIV